MIVKKSLVSAFVATLLGAQAVASAATPVDAAGPDEAAAPTQEAKPVTETAYSSILTAINIGPILQYIVQPTTMCTRWNGTACAPGDMTNPSFRQILLLPAGYQEADRAQFWSDFATFRNKMANSGTVWSTQKRDRILWIGYFLPGDALGPSANFGAYIAPHPVRGLALTLSNQGVYDKVDELKATALTTLNPMGTMVIFNAIPTEKVTANAAPPSFTGKSFGIAKMTRGDLGTGYIASHEMAHASLNFLDEYVEAGMEDLNIHSIDALTPLVIFDGSWAGAWLAINNLIGRYDYRMSDVLAGNGNVNIATQSVPSTVYSPISAPMRYDYEGGMFFGRGTFHMMGDNLMNDDHVVRGAGDSFAYAHSGDQQEQIETAFGDQAYRANDRLRAAGPLTDWIPSLGSSTHVLWYDGDKLNHAHGTQAYAVEVGWYDREWYTAWWGPFPYPAYNDVWKSALKYVYPQKHTINLAASAAYNLADLLQGIVCESGMITEVKGFKLCLQPISQMAPAFIPALNLIFETPYEETDIPNNQWFTKFWWHVATFNKTTPSGWTAWSSYYRAF
jgi:hypothetical protein